MFVQERDNFLKALASRGPGKRQIKPSATIFQEVVAAGADDDDEDEDFTAGPLGSDDSDNESEEEGDEVDEEEDEDEEEEDNEPDNALEDEQNGIFFKENGLQLRKNSQGLLKSSQEDPMICTICLNLRRATKDSEIIQCDKCGLAVHEACYAVEELSDDQSVTSSSSTEPWFCEPCVFGLNTVPYCELCPNRYGAFKKADIGGGWVHLICALFTPGISFGDVDHLTAVSWQELDYKAFGRKTCAHCVDKLDSRTGVSVQCEAGLCRTYYHVTCAQKLGLLIDALSEDHLSCQYTEKNGHHEAIDSSISGGLDTNFLYCKKHNHTELLKSKKEAYSVFMRQENCRMLNFNRPILTSRQEYKRRIQLQNYLTRTKKLENVVVILPALHNKKTKMLHSSPEFLDLFVEKSELLGLNRKEFIEQFLRVPSEQIPCIPPTFDPNFVRYVKKREETAIPEEKQCLQKAVQKKELAINEQKQLEFNIKMIQEKLPKIQQQNLAANQLLNRFCNILYALSGHSKKSLAVPFKIFPKNFKSKLKLTKPSLNLPSLNPISLKILAINSPRDSIVTTTLKEHCTIKTDIKSCTTSNVNISPSKNPFSKRPNILSRSSPKKLSLPIHLAEMIEPLKIKIPHGTYLKKSPKSQKNSPKITSPPQLSMTPKNLSPLAFPLSSSTTKSCGKLTSPLQHFSITSTSSLLMEQIRTCKTCKKVNNQHLLIYCVTCKNFYHIGCLDPPLKRVPAFKKNYLFECSDCAFPDSSNESTNSQKISLNDSEKRTRKTNKRGETHSEDNDSHDLNSSVASRRKFRKRRSALESVVSRMDQTPLKRKKFKRFASLGDLDEVMDQKMAGQNSSLKRRKRKYTKRGRISVPDIENLSAAQNIEIST